MESKLTYKKPIPMLNMTIKYRSLVNKKKIYKVKKSQVRIPMSDRFVNKYETLPSDVRFIIKTICDIMGVPPACILEDSRKKEFVEPRHLCIYFTYQYIRSSPTVVSRWFNRDHSIVYTALENVNNFKETEKRYKRQFDEIERIISKELIPVIKNNLPDNQYVESILKYMC